MLKNERIKMLTDLIKGYSLPEEKAKYLLEKFNGISDIVASWKKEADTIIITSDDQTDLMAKAREGRLVLKEKRILIENTRKLLKKDCLNEGRAIDTLAGTFENMITPIEKDLESKENYIKLKQEKIKKELRLKREELLGDSIKFLSHGIDLGSIDDQSFNIILDVCKKKELEQKLLIENEEKERQRIFDENKRLKEENKKLQEHSKPVIRVFPSEKKAFTEKSLSQVWVEKCNKAVSIGLSSKHFIFEHNSKYYLVERIGKDSFSAQVDVPIL